MPFNDAAVGVISRRVGIGNFRWHDLRHTWASWHAQNGTPLHVLQELGGWESPLMIRRYAHFATEHLAAYVNNAGFLGTIWSQPKLGQTETIPSP